MNIVRTRLHAQVQRALFRSRAVVLAGPRQSGKTTLAASLVSRGSARWFDLENPVDLQRLKERLIALSALQALASGNTSDAHGPIVIDEVLLAPGLFQVLRVLIDRSPTNGQFLLLGSASPALWRQACESLLGHVAVIEVGGFGIHEINIAAPAMLRFWRMLAHFHGQIWNAADPARSLAVSEPTVRRWLDVLTQTFMVRQLLSWHQNLGKRQVRAAKIYFRDSGLLHALIGLPSMDALLHHPRNGASREGFALEQVLRLAAPDEAYFWATHNGAGLDLLLLKDGQRVGVEFKRADAPGAAQSMKIAMEELQLDRL
jgi:uncharacterized protein